MNPKIPRIVYLVATGLLSALMLMSAGMYVFNHQMVAETFTKLGFPTFVIYPLALAKVLGLVAIWTRKSATLREWAYAGFFFNFVLGFSAHTAIGDGESGGALLALMLLFASYYFGGKLKAGSKK